MGRVYITDCDMATEAFDMLRQLQDYPRCVHEHFAECLSRAITTHRDPSATDLSQGIADLVDATIEDFIESAKSALEFGRKLDER